MWPANPGGAGRTDAGDDVVLDMRTKGIAAGVRQPRSGVRDKRWGLFDAHVATPVAALRDSAVAHNIEVMRTFCMRSGVQIAPHGKTTMSPELIARQLAAGAWGISAATPQQLAILLDMGVRRVLVANEVVDRAALHWLAATLQARPDLEVLWYVDSRAGLARAEQAMAGAARRPGLLVELGHEGGRTGLRSNAEALDLARATASSEHVELAGIAGYEGTIGVSRDADTTARVDGFLTRMADAAHAVQRDGLMPEHRRLVVSAGGSVFFDRVPQILGRVSDADVVLRSGCYLTHDHGMYERATPAAQPGWSLERFQPAIEVWGQVLSRPEPGLVLTDCGRRDLSHDAGLPTPLWHVPEGDRLRRRLTGATVSGLSDQHAFVDVPDDSDVAVGDLVGFGISHPCTTFDRWPNLLLIDDGDRVIDVVRTWF